MLKPFLIICFIAISCFYIDVDGKIFNINLVRRKSPRQNLQLAKQYGFDLKEYEDKPKNASNYTLALKRYLDNEFYGSVRIGSTGQKYYVIFDISWTISWIMSTYCSAKVKGCTGHRLYDHTRSATYFPNGTKYLNNEGQYNLTGFYSVDKINYGGVKLINQSFVEMTYVPPEFALMKADGVIGFALPYAGETSLPLLLYEQKLLKQPVFSIYLNRDTQSNRGGSIMLGGIDTKHIHVTNKVPDKVTYVKVDDSLGLWSFTLDGVSILQAKKSIPICVHNCKAYVDTGSINIYASQEEVEKINSVISALPDPDNPGFFLIDCATIMKLPPINFVIAGQTFAMRGEDYVQRKINGNVMECFSIFVAPSTPSEEGSWILGGGFLARFFSIYNFVDRTVGFVTAA